jgi:hypothetical protein
MSLEMRLSRLPQLPPPVLTAYIDVNPGNPRNQGTPRGYITWLKSNGRALSRELSRDARKTFRTQLARIEKFLRTKRSSSRSIIVLAGPHVWDSVPLQVDITEELHWGKPSLQQMTWILDEHRPRGAVLIDGSGARCFRFWLGMVTEDEGATYSVDISSWRKPHLVGPSTSAVAKQYGVQRDRVKNRMATQRDRFVRSLAGHIVRWSAEHGMDQVILVGAPGDVASTCKALPARFREQTTLVQKTLTGITAGDVKNRLQSILEKWERDYEDRLVGALVSRQRKAIIGLDRTLAELQRGRVRELVVARGISGSVRECLNCGWIDRTADPNCAICNSTRRSRSLRTAIPELASIHAVPVEVVAGKAAEKLRRVGGIGAWLRISKRGGYPAARHQRAD